VDIKLQLQWEQYTTDMAREGWTDDMIDEPRCICYKTCNTYY